MIILDARAVMYHSYHIGEDPESLMDDEGITANTAEFAFSNFMERYMLPILEMDSPSDIVVVHDSGTVYRSNIFPEYKKTKSRDVPEIQKKEQDRLFKAMQTFWAAIGCTQLSVEGVEADDIIAYLCERIDENIEVYTTDADLLQLQGDYDNVQVFLKCEPFEDDNHKGIPLKYISFSKSLLGDSSDNYIGIKGFGSKAWEGLVNSFGYDGIEELIECVDKNKFDLIEEVLAENPDKNLQKLWDNRVEWRKSWKLAKLNPSLCWKPSKKSLTEIKWYKKVPNAEVVASTLSKMGCQDLLDNAEVVASTFSKMGCQDLLDNANIEKHLPVSWLLTNSEVDEELFIAFEKECKSSPFVSFDYETYPSDNAMRVDPKWKPFVDAKEAKIAGASFTFGASSNKTFYIPINHKDTDNCDQATLERLLDIAETSSTLVVQNAFFELAVTKSQMGKWLKPLWDTRIMGSYVDENKELGLKFMSKEWLGYTQTSYADTVKAVDSEGVEYMRTVDELTGDEVLKYGCDDAIVTAELFVLFSLILKLEGTYNFVKENETCSQHSLVDAYLNGVNIDWNALKAQRVKDFTTVEESYKALRQVLSENCSNPNKKAANDFFECQKGYIKKLAKKRFMDKFDGEFDDAASEELSQAIAHACEEFKDKALRASMYEEYRVVKQPLEFKPTASQFNEVIEKLGFSTPLIGASRKALSDWLVEVSAVDFEDDAETVELTPKQFEFCTLLGDALDQIKGREGEEYERLAKFCSANRIKEGKEITYGDELNTGSPIQMQHLLYCKLGLPVRLTNMVDKGSTRDQLGISYGSPQTDALAIDTALAEDVEEGSWKEVALKSIKAIKDAKTRISLYHDTYPLWRHMSDGRIHPQVKNCGTVTRRPSGASPNILQVSKHQQDGVMRSIFLPNSEDEVIVSIDFSQQELRIMASECKDENLISCYVGDNLRDVHSMTASGIAKVDYEEYMKHYKDEDSDKHKEYVTIRKRPAKQTNFLLAYMGTAFTLATRLIIPEKVANDMMDSAYETYPRIQPWQGEVSKFSAEHGYSLSSYGNRRHMTEAILSKNNSERSRMERQAVNFTIQGTAADILKIVLTKCWKTKLWVDTSATLIAPVYDEITSSVPKSNVVEYINRLVEIMEITPPNHAVQMKADVSLGANWRDQIEIGLNPSEETILNALKEIENND